MFKKISFTLLLIISQNLYASNINTVCTNLTKNIQISKDKITILYNFVLLEYKKECFNPTTKEKINTLNNNKEKLDYYINHLYYYSYKTQYLCKNNYDDIYKLKEVYWKTLKQSINTCVKNINQ